MAPDSAGAAPPPAGAPSAVIRKEAGELLQLAGPVVVARLGIMAMGLSDAIVVGRYSAQQLGYHALAWAPTGVVMTLAIGLLMGVQVMTARALGEGRRSAAGAVLRRGVVYSLWIGIPCAAVLTLLAPIGLASVGLEPDLARGSGRVVVIFALSLPIYVTACACSFWLEALSKPVPAMLMMWMANVVNVAFLLVLVPGNFGLPALGAVGAAWATFGARVALLGGLVAYIALMPEARALGVFRKPPREPAAEAEQRRVGYGAGVSNFFEVAAFSSLNIMAGWLGGLAVAAWTVVLNVASVIFMVPMGLATATAVLVGRAYGARDRAGLVRAGFIGFSVTAGFGMLVSLIVWPSAELISKAYTTDATVIAMAAPALVLSCLFYMADCMQVVIAQALRARGDIWLPTGTHLASYVVVMMPLAWLFALPFGWGLEGMVWAVIVASLCAMGFLFARFWVLSRRAL